MAYYEKLLTSNSAATSFGSRIPTVTAPVDGASAAGDSKVFTPDVSHDTIEIMPFGTSAADQTMAFQVVGWRQTGGATSIWVPTLICTCVGTLCTATGVASADVLNTDYLCDAITVTTGVTVVPSVTANTPAVALINIEGFQKYEVMVQRNSSAATVNALVAEY